MNSRRLLNFYEPNNMHRCIAALLLLSAFHASAQMKVTYPDKMGPFPDVEVAVPVVPPIARNSASVATTLV